MNSKYILSQAQKFLSLASSDNLPEDSDNIQTILKNLSEIEEFKNRIKYADQNMTQLSSGSARVVFKISGENESVIKLAKNEKGLAQNEAESNPEMKSKYLNKVEDKADNFSWIKVPYLDKMTVSSFKKATRVEFKDFGEAIEYGLKNVSDSDKKEKPKNFKQVSESEIYQEVKRLANKFKLMPGDLSRISSWGLSGDDPKIVDAGLTRKIYLEFYD